MEIIECGLTVFFDAPFWVGVIERRRNGRLTVCRQTFGAEPKDPEILEWILRDWHQLRFGPAVSADARRRAHPNPKRMQREVRRQTAARGIGTHSQQAIQLERAQNKLERRTRSREDREREAQRQYDIRQQKRKEKHRGR